MPVSCRRRFEWLWSTCIDLGAKTDELSLFLGCDLGFRRSVLAEV